MTANACMVVRRKLGAYVDGELAGGERLRVADHLDVCQACTGELDALSSVGDLLRRSAQEDARSMDLGGLASGVVARFRAEAAQSWRSIFARAVYDCRWLVVGTGSLAGTTASALAVTLMLFFGAPEREDSLAALLRNLGSPAGTLFVVTASEAGGSAPVMMEFTRDGRVRRTRIVEAIPARLSRRQFGQALALAEAVTRQGRVTGLSEMGEADREHAEALLDAINQGNSAAFVGVRGRQLQVRELHLVTSTGVTAKGL